MATYYITKRVLTAGIEVVETNNEPKGNMLVIDGAYPGAWKTYYYGEGRDWHRTMDAAVRRAGELRVNKIKSIEKSIKKIKQLTFKKP